MPWFKVDDDLAFHRKIVKAGNAAMGLWVRSGAWCAQQLTDGFIPDDMVELLGTASQRRKLINAGLWTEVEGGCVFYGWNKNGRQPTSQSVREKRADAARRQQEYRDRLSKNQQASGARNAVTDTSVTDSVTPVLTPPPTRPDPSSSTEELFAAAAAPAAADSTVSAHTLVTEWIDTCRNRPPGSVIARTGKEIKAMLAEGIDPADVRSGVAIWAQKGLSPAALPSVVNQVMNQPAGRGHLRAVGDYQPWTNPDDDSVYLQEF